MTSDQASTVRKCTTHSAANPRSVLQIAGVEITPANVDRVKGMLVGNISPQRIIQQLQIEKGE